VSGGCHAEQHAGPAGLTGVHREAGQGQEGDLYGAPPQVMFLAMLFACANLLAVVVDHYDQRNNEHSYQRIAKLTQIAGWTAFGLALVLDLFVFHGRK